MGHRVMFKFVGGPHDGGVVAGEAGGEQYKDIDALLSISHGGTVGDHIWLPTEYAVNALRSLPWDEIDQLAAQGYRFPGHIYEIDVRWQKREYVLIRARHLGPSE